VEATPDLLQPEKLAEYCENFIVWGVPTAAKIEYLEPRNGSLRAVGGLKFPPTQTGTFDLWLAAISNPGTAYLGFGISKPLFSGVYPREAYQVRERFPLLRLRLANVPRQALFSELGKGSAPPGTIAYPANRDEIVIGELLKRGR